MIDNAAFAPAPPTPGEGASAPVPLASNTARMGTWGRLVVLALLLLGIKFALIRAYGSPVPAWDQWPAEGDRLIRPWLAGQLGWGDLLGYHNEHRILLTRLLVLLLTWANTQWDALVEMSVSAVLHTVCAVFLGAILLPRGNPGRANLLVGALVLLFGLPFGWENTLNGFQSQFYFLLLTSALAVWGLTGRRVGRPGWCLGLAAAVLACFSMASGVLASLAVALWLGVRMTTMRQKARRGDGITLAISSAIFLGGFLLTGPPGRDQPNPFVARSVGEFFGAFGNVLGWPNGIHPVLAIPAYFPLGYLAWRWLRHERGWGPAGVEIPEAAETTASSGSFLLPMGLWTILQAAALAWARGNYHGLAQNGLWVSRYMDLASIGVLVNFACLLCIASALLRSPWLTTSRARLGMLALVALWPVVVVFGLGGITGLNVQKGLPYQDRLNAREAEVLQALVHTRDVQVLGGRNRGLTRCEDPQLLARLLIGEPVMKGVLPALLQPALALAPAADQEQGFIAREGMLPSSEVASEVAWVAAGQPTMEQTPARFSSQLLRARLPYLEFLVREPTSGASGRAYLRLVPPVDDPGRDGRFAWLPEGDSGSRLVTWKSVFIRAPSSPFRVEAQGGSAPGERGMMMFSNPREVGWLSVHTRDVLGWDLYFIVVGVALWVGLICWEGCSVGERG